MNWQDGMALGMKVASAVMVMVSKIDTGGIPFLEQSFTVKGYTISVSVAKEPSPIVAAKSKRGRK